MPAPAAAQRPRRFSNSKVAPPARGPGPALRRYRSQSRLHPSHCVRIDLVVFSVGSEEANLDDGRLILNTRNQSVVVPFDVEDGPTGLENASFRIRRLDFLRVAPLGMADDGQPSLILRAGGLDALMAGAIAKMSLDHAHADNDHRCQFGIKFQKLEALNPAKHRLLWGASSAKLDPREFDHLAPLGVLVGDLLAVVGGAHRHRDVAELDETASH